MTDPDFKVTESAQAIPTQQTSAIIIFIALIFVSMFNQSPQQNHACENVT